jgi:hypothetical protein
VPINPDYGCLLTLAMQRMLKPVQKLSGLSRTVPFTMSKQIKLFKYTSGRWLYNGGGTWVIQLGSSIVLNMVVG